MKNKDWFAAVCAFPSAVFDGFEAFLKQIELDEKEVLNGAEYDPEEI